MTEWRVLSDKCDISRVYIILRVICTVTTAVRKKRKTINVKIFHPAWRKMEKAKSSMGTFKLYLGEVN